MSLTKAMYGDLNCNLFGLSYGQIRTDALIQSAGWFNNKGEKLGYGDLNLQDLICIRRNLCEDNFIVLSEGNSLWNIPSGMDKTAPGLEYVMENASWVIDCGVIYRVANLNKEFEWVDTDDGTYLKCTKAYLFEAVDYPKTPAPITVRSADDGTHYGLKTLWISDSITMNPVLYAYGTLKEFEESAIRKAEDMMWVYTTYASINKFVPISVEDMNSLDAAIEKKEKKANGLIRIILGKHLPDFIKHLAKSNMAELMSPLDGDVFLPGDIYGIPKDCYAVRI